MTNFEGTWLSVGEVLYDLAWYFINLLAILNWFDLLKFIDFKEFKWSEWYTWTSQLKKKNEKIEKIEKKNKIKFKKNGNNSIIPYTHTLTLIPNPNPNPYCNPNPNTKINKYLHRSLYHYELVLTSHN